MSSIGESLKRLFKTFDRKDFATVLSMMDRNAEGIDEITRRWIRGKSAIKDHIKRVGPEISNIKSSVGGLRTRRIGDVGVATCLVRQSYTLSGKRSKLNLATSVVFVRRKGGWKLTLIHQTPL